MTSHLTLPTYACLLVNMRSTDEMATTVADEYQSVPFNPYDANMPMPNGQADDQRFVHLRVEPGASIHFNPGHGAKHFEGMRYERFNVKCTQCVLRRYA